MAERRMFTKKITDSDAFTGLPPTTQTLYFHLCMNADDDGFNNKIRQAMFNAHADLNDYNLLIQHRFIIPFEDKGVIVIKHWRLHNIIRNDRYHRTEYVEEKARLILKENGVYTESDNQMTTMCQPSDNQMETEVRLGKDSIGKDNIYCAHFEETYKVYPRKGDKKRAYACYKARLNEGYSEDELYQAAKKYAAFCLKENREQKYIKTAPTFFGVNTPFVDYLPRQKDLPAIHLRNQSQEEITKFPYYGLPKEWFKGDMITSALISESVKDADTGEIYTPDDIIDIYYLRREKALGDEEDLELRHGT